MQDGTHVTQCEEYRGIRVLLWDPAWVEEAYRQANLNLRSLLESPEPDGIENHEP